MESGLPSRLCLQRQSANPQKPFDIAEQWEARFRLAPLTLAGAIVASARYEFPDELQAYNVIVERLHSLTFKTLQPSFGENDFIYLLQAFLSFEGERFWSENLDRLCDGEFEGSCDACTGYLLIAFGEHGFFVTTELWTDPLKVTRYPLLPCLTEELPEEGAWLFERCKKYGYEERAHWFRYLFGQVVCPHCGQQISVADAIKNGY